VQACGICHSDVITKEGLFPGITYARVPGHEVVGVIDEVGAGVKEGRKVSGLGSAGTVGKTAPVLRADAETS
jgi:D-arabinose 1-dehydrogenase-like Zn-dependent alcohol dehydrogenase